METTAADRTAPAAFRRSADVDQESFEDELLLFQRSHRSVLALNASAAAIWDALAWPQTEADLAQLLVESGAAASESDAAPIVTDLIDTLRAHHCIVRTG
jgi:hypothetical protein